MDFNIFLEVYSACSFQDNLLSIMTPIHFVFETMSSGWLFILIMISLLEYDLLFPKIIKWVFPILSERRFAVSQSTSLGISILIVVCSETMLGPEANRFESSANNSEDTILEKFDKSLI